MPEGLIQLTRQLGLEAQVAASGFEATARAMPAVESGVRGVLDAISGGPGGGGGDGSSRLERMSVRVSPDGSIRQPENRSGGAGGGGGNSSSRIPAGLGTLTDKIEASMRAFAERTTRQPTAGDVAVVRALDGLRALISEQNRMMARVPDGGIDRRTGAEA